MRDFKPQIWNGVPIPYNAHVADLRGMVESPGPRAWAAIRALAEKPEPDALAVLVELTGSSDPHVRRSTVEAIGIHRSGRTVSDVVCQLLQDPADFVVRSAIQAAANLGLGAAHERVLSLVKAAEESTRLAALHALKDLWRPSDFDAVFDRYIHDRSDGVRKQAAWTVHKNAGKEHWERVFSAWSKDLVPRHRVWACELAGSFGSRAVLPALVTLRTDRDGHVRRAARRAAERIDAA